MQHITHAHAHTHAYTHAYTCIGVGMKEQAAWKQKRHIFSEEASFPQSSTKTDHEPTHVYLTINKSSWGGGGRGKPA